MAMSLTALRSNLYTVVDKVIATGTPAEIERNGHIVKIIVEEPKNKLDNLTLHPGTLIGDPEDFVHMNWLTEWNEGENL